MGEQHCVSLFKAVVLKLATYGKLLVSENTPVGNRKCEVNRAVFALNASFSDKSLICCIYALNNEFYFYLNKY